MRREGSASVVFGRSKEMRAGLSMVKDIGCGAGPESCRVSCSCCAAQGLHVDRLQAHLILGGAGGGRGGR